jgi:GxxExxY protein
MKDMNHEIHEQHEIILFREESYAIQGAIFEVYRHIGYGFLEPVYQECLEIELRKRKIPFIAQKELHIVYKGETLEQKYKPDIICYDKIILELKAVKNIADEHKAQLLNYLRATGLRLGLLINFAHHPKVQILRVVL